MINFMVFLLFLLPLNVQPLRRPIPPDTTTQPPQFPAEHHDRDFTNRVVIPNESFCNKMALRGSDFYMVMPWWYHYCENLKDKARKGMRADEKDRAHIIKPYLNVLEKVKQYKQRQKQLKHMIRYETR